jgi:hypothetical protein
MKYIDPFPINAPLPQVHTTPEFSMELCCHGNDRYTKVSYPVKYGLFSRLETRDYILEFNLNHEIRHARSKKNTWLHPSEWLKRTAGNDWVYYSSGGYSGVYEALGEYYLPNLTYPTNSLLGGKPFEEEGIQEIITRWPDILMSLQDKGLPHEFSQWLRNIRKNTPELLEKKAQSLFEIIGSRVTVMPPDARHTDYNFIPLTIADGCLYKCAFCKIKNKKPFSVRSQADIGRQIAELKTLYGEDIINYNALFLGEHDALNAPADLILETLEKAHEEFGFASSFMKDNFLFIFGSADSFLNADPLLFDGLKKLSFQTFINIGLESCDKTTLNRIGKPITPEKVRAAFEKAQQINQTLPNVEISCNFIMDEDLPPTHTEALLSLLRQSNWRISPKGSIYLSPLKFSSPSREVLYEFYKLKSLSRFPTFLYLIQRL